MAQAHFDTTPVGRPKPKKFSSPWERALAGTDKLFEAVEARGENQNPDSAEKQDKTPKKDDNNTHDSDLTAEELAWEEKQKKLFDQRMEVEDEAEGPDSRSYIGGRSDFDLRATMRGSNRDSGRDRGRDQGRHRDDRDNRRSKEDRNREREREKDNRGEQSRDARDKGRDRARDKGARNRDRLSGGYRNDKVTEEIIVDQFGRDSTRESNSRRGRNANDDSKRNANDDSKRHRDASPDQHRSNKRGKFRNERKRVDDDGVEIVDKRRPRERGQVEVETEEKRKEMKANKRKKLLQELKEVELAIARKKAAAAKNTSRR